MGYSPERRAAVLKRMLPPNNLPARLSNRHRPLHPSPRTDIVCASHAPCRHQGKAPAQSRHRISHHPAAKAHSPDAQRHDPLADASHTTKVHGGHHGKENWNGSYGNKNPFTRKHQQLLRVLKDSQYTYLFWDQRNFNSFISIGIDWLNYRTSSKLLLYRSYPKTRTFS